MKNEEDRKTSNGFMKARIWGRDGRLCKRCGKVLYLSLNPKGHVHHIDINRENNKATNLVLLCSSCHKKLHNLYMSDQLKYTLELEGIMGVEYLAFGERVESSYRFWYVSSLLANLERENNMLKLLDRDKERLDYLKALKGKLEAEYKKSIKAMEESEEI